MPRLLKLTLNIYLYQLKGQDLALSNDMHIFLQMMSIRSAIVAFDVIMMLQHALHYTN